jgi:hypothetical protein
MYKLGPRFAENTNFFHRHFECYGFTYNVTTTTSERVHRGLNERRFFALQSALGCTCQKALTKEQEMQIHISAKYLDFSKAEI